MKRILVVLLLGFWSAAFAQESWLGLFMQNKKIGYSYNRIASDKLGGVLMTRSDTHTLINAGLLGTAMTMDMRSTTWSSVGKPKRMVFRMESSGRVQTMDAAFGGKEITVQLENGGAKSTRTIPLPNEGIVVDDALSAMIASKKPAAGTRTFYVLDPLTISLVKNTVTVKGKERVQIRGKTVQATRVDVVEIRATTKVYVDSKGDILKAVGPMGIEMIPLSKKDALAVGDSSPGPDLAAASSIKTDKPITDVGSLNTLTLRVTGRDLSKLPSDDHQTVRRDGKAWIVEIHPVKVSKVTDETVETAARGKPTWLGPTMNIPSDSAAFKALAQEIVGDAKTVVPASRKIQEYVHDNMRFNAGIGVLRDASEVLSSKEGVCRDYAVLTTTLLRSAGIPARLASGIVYADGRFFYHAWSEAWAGDRWIGIDSTRIAKQVTATHVKLADGNVDEAFTFTFLEDAKIQVASLGR